jgi:hypothetical protein
VGVSSHGWPRDRWNSFLTILSSLSLTVLIESTADENLMTFVNMLGLVTFISIVFYHFVVSSKKDAEA